MFSSPFAVIQQTLSIPLDTEIVFVADLFVDDYVGGAELTTEALITSSPMKVFKLKSRDVTMKLLESGQSMFWIFGNFSQVNHELIPAIIANMNYAVLEYDYKYCKWRSPQKHETVENKSCDDETSLHGKLISAFMMSAKSLWWMSERQMSHYHSKFPYLTDKNNTVLSSVFDDNFFVSVKALNERRETNQIPRKGWIVLGSNSWVKGADDAEKYCVDNNLDYEVVWNLSYSELLSKLSLAEGFVYLPKGWDTCPRMVIEAKLLGCKLHVNDNVQNLHEDWFETDDILMTESYLYAARDLFWAGIKENMSWKPTISGYTTTYNCNTHKYPWKQSIQSLLGFCDEVVVVDGGSTDNTYEELISWSKHEPKLKIVLNTRDWTHPRFAVYDGDQKACARGHCTSQFLWQQDADEVVHENDYNKIIDLCTKFPKMVDIIALPVIEYWGGYDKVRLDVNPWKWRLSINKPNITHGIPSHFRRHDSDHNLYAAQGTDGCDYIDKDTYNVIPHAGFYTADAHNARMAALNKNAQAYDSYAEWFKNIVAGLPSVHHYSWFDLERKIGTYRNYWSKHWQSLYDITQEDTVENNMFFDKKWENVTDDDIKNLASDLKSKMGGWIFHSKVDFSKPTPHLKPTCSQPKVMLT